MKSMVGLILSFFVSYASLQTANKGDENDHNSGLVNFVITSPTGVRTAGECDLITNVHMYDCEYSYAISQLKTGETLLFQEGNYPGSKENQRLDVVEWQKRKREINTFYSEDHNVYSRNYSRDSPRWDNGSSISSYGRNKP